MWAGRYRRHGCNVQQGSMCNEGVCAHTWSGAGCCHAGGAKLAAHSHVRTANVDYRARDCASLTKIISDLPGEEEASERTVAFSLSGKHCRWKLDVPRCNGCPCVNAVACRALVSVTGMPCPD